MEQRRISDNAFGADPLHIAAGPAVNFSLGNPDGRMGEWLNPAGISSSGHAVFGGSCSAGRRDQGFGITRGVIATIDSEY